jgi:hypothetical protein
MITNLFHPGNNRAVCYNKKKYIYIIHDSVCRNLDRKRAQARELTDSFQIVSNFSQRIFIGGFYLMCNSCEHSRTDNVDKIFSVSVKYAQIDTPRLICRNAFNIGFPISLDTEMCRKIIRGSAAEYAKRYICFRLQHGIYDGMHCAVSTGRKDAVRMNLTEKTTQIILLSSTCAVGAEQDIMTLKHFN